MGQDVQAGLGDARIRPQHTSASLIKLTIYHISRDNNSQAENTCDDLM